MSAYHHIEKLLSQGRYLEARLEADRLLPSAASLRLEQLYGLALSKSGMPEQALQRLEPLYRANPEDPETAGILGSVYKELFKKNQQTNFALQARDTYLKNFSLTKSFYTGINAAAMSAMIMQGSKSRDLAKEIVGMISPETEDFWELATLGEAYLLMKENARAVEYYLKARKVAANDWGKVGSVYNQLWLLNHYIPVQREAMRIFHPPGIVAFVGHMIDHPSRKTPRFPPAIEAPIKNAIVSNLRTINAHIGFCSLACGSDIVFAEAMAELGGELNIFLPFDTEDFVDTSVRFAGEPWVERFRSLVARYPVHMCTTGRYGDDDLLFDFQARQIFGSAVLRSLPQQNKVTLLSVLSEMDLKRKIGGTSHSVSLWPYREHHVNINPDVFLDAGARAGEAPPPIVHRPDPNRKLRILVAVNLSGIIPLYKDQVSKYLAHKDAVTDQFVRVDPRPDVVLFAFEHEFGAIDLVQHLYSLFKNFAGQQLSLRLHAGLVYENNGQLSGDSIDTVDALTDLNLKGCYASEQAAALLALQLKKFSVDFAGSVHMKHDVHCPVYKILPVNG